MSTYAEEPTFEQNLWRYSKYGLYTIAGIFILSTVISMFNTVQLGHTVVYQNAISGKKTVYHGPDFIIKPPFVATITDYKKDTTLSFAPGQDGDDFTSTNPAISIAFADTYKAHLLVNARMVLPSGDEQMLALHEAFRTYDNLVRSLYTKTMIDVAVNTATQFTAEEVFQGGLNGLKSAIEDQANDGVYVTHRMKVLAESGTTDRTDIGGKKTDSAATHKAVYVWKAVPLRDRAGKIRRTKNPLEQYGVSVTQVNLAEPIPEKLLDTLLDRKKKLVAEKIASIQEQENAKTEIETAKLKGEAARVKAEQVQLVIADAAIITQKKEVKIAQQIALREIVEKQKLADLAIINKTKELQIAVANEGIEEANAKAAKHQANAIEYKGFAEANVKKAMYLAVREDILTLEVEKATQIAKYQAMKTAQVTLPESVTIMAGGSGDAPTLDTLSNYAILGMKDALQKTTATPVAK